MHSGAGHADGRDTVQIDDYHFGSITVDGSTYGSDVIISPDGVDPSWWRKEGHDLCCEDLAPVLAAEPDALVIGTGAYGVMKAQPNALRLAQSRCGQVHVLPTTQAWVRYNGLVEQGAGRVVAALHLTC